MTLLGPWLLIAITACRKKQPYNYQYQAEGKLETEDHYSRPGVGTSQKLEDVIKQTLFTVLRTRVRGSLDCKSEKNKYYMSADGCAS